MDRREFAFVLPALFAALNPTLSEGESLGPLSSGVYKAGPAKPSSVPKRASRGFTQGMLNGGTIRVEMHQSTQEVGAPHEPEETHKHTEIWFVTAGEVTLTINGQPHKISTGEVGICVAGDRHYLQNSGQTPATYLVVAVGPPE